MSRRKRRRRRFLSDICLTAMCLLSPSVCFFAGVERNVAVTSMYKDVLSCSCEHSYVAQCRTLSFDTCSLPILVLPSKVGNYFIKIKINDTSHVGHRIINQQSKKAFFLLCKCSDAGLTIIICSVESQRLSCVHCFHLVPVLLAWFCPFLFVCTN